MTDLPFFILAMVFGFHVFGTLCEEALDENGVPGREPSSLTGIITGGCFGVLVLAALGGF